MSGDEAPTTLLSRLTLAKALNAGLRKALEADQLGHDLREGCKAMPDPEPLSMFDHVYADETVEIAQERADYADYLAGFDETAGV